MTPHSPPILFEAHCVPPSSLGRRGAWIATGAIAVACLIEGVVFLTLGAWPVLGFGILEAGVVLGLFHLHRRWSARMLEVLVLTEHGLTIRRTDHQGRREAIELDPYWARLRLDEVPGRVSRLVLQQRDRQVEIAAMLGEEQKRDLAEALGAALQRWREPVFDNPQLRDG